MLAKLLLQATSLFAEERGNLSAIRPIARTELPIALTLARIHPGGVRTYEQADSSSSTDHYSED